MQKFLQWLDDHDLLDPLEQALGIVGMILFGMWIIALVIVFFGILILTFGSSAWWLLAYIPWIILLTASLTLGFYIKE